MSLSASLQQQRQERIRKGPMCRVCLLIATVDAEDREALEAALADEGMAHTQISRALKAEGLDYAPNTIARHRRGDCQSCR